ncbi:MAG TPA: dienelactone hydrolase family protein [Shinella sp.]|jgi:phospholipase/carboxylesterase|uniref:alpha/beta hydrolase n=1 Tax=Shinella sp. TaxID=1870904 RepID=UPI002E0FB927|nr:dienelactone hydrolase family protein [Shinella sp.]
MTDLPPVAASFRDIKLTSNSGNFLKSAIALVMAMTSLVPPMKAAASERADVVAGRRVQGSDADVIGASETRQARRLVIFFHGIRGRGSVMAAIGESWKATLRETEFVSPDAPFAHRSGGRQWFTVDDQVLRPDRIKAARRAFDEVVSDIIQREGFQNDLQDVAFVGVSQGAIMALDAVASGRWKVGALVSFAGLMPLPPTSSSSDTSILLIHGGADGTIPSTASVAASGQLKSAGYDVTLKIFPNVGHTISSEQARHAVSYLKGRLDG